jgi:hypothetical protein
MADNAKVLHHIIEKKDLLYDFERPMKPFFIKIPNFWAWSDNLGR